MGKGRMLGTGSWPWALTDTSLYLLNYSMEAVSFTEFIFSEAVQFGIGLLRIIKKHKEYEELRYFSNKFYGNVWYPAISFHYSYGQLNPYTFYAFTDLYKYYWHQYQSIIKVDSKFFTGYSQKEQTWLSGVMEIMDDMIDELDFQVK
jgi:hypothetical protein